MTPDQTLLYMIIYFISGPRYGKRNESIQTLEQWLMVYPDGSGIERSGMHIINGLKMKF